MTQPKPPTHNLSRERLLIIKRGFDAFIQAKREREAKAGMKERAA